MKLDDGHSTRIGFSLDPTVEIYEKTVQPPGLEGGGENNTTTMLNVLYRTKSPKKLVTLSEASLKVAYDTKSYTTILAMLNKNQLITITFPDASTYAFYGWIDEFKPSDLEDGKQPEATVKIIPSNQNAAGAEAAPVWTIGTTTTTTAAT